MKLQYSRQPHDHNLGKKIELLEKQTTSLFHQDEVTGYFIHNQTFCSSKFKYLFFNFSIYPLEILKKNKTFLHK